MAEMPGKIVPFKSLDVLRGLAALWVVMCHSADHYVGGTPWEKWPLYSFSLRGQLGVVLFFLISGFVGNLYLVSWGLQIVVAVLASWVFYLAIERHFVSSRQKRRIATELAEAQ
jgi:peptidoglycan/LPS O-acetylase OafA/YrhL